MKFHHDIHTHTQISSCSEDITATPQNFIRTAAELGHTTFGFSNHLWDESVEGASDFYHKQSFTHVLPEKDLIFSLDNCGIKILFGAEVEYCGKSDTLALRAENAPLLDYVLVPHTHTHMEGFVIPEIEQVTEYKAKLAAELKAAYPWMSQRIINRTLKSVKLQDVLPVIDYTIEEYDAYVAEFMMKSYEQLLENTEFEKISKTIPTIIAHPFAPVGTLHRIEPTYELIDKERLRQAFIKTAKMGVALDVNVNVFRFYNELEREPLVKMLRLAKECGVKMAFGTDAHDVKVLPSIYKGDAIADAVGITNDDIFELVK